METLVRSLASDASTLKYLNPCPIIVRRISFHRFVSAAFSNATLRLRFVGWRTRYRTDSGREIENRDRVNRAQGLFLGRVGRPSEFWLLPRLGNCTDGWWMTRRSSGFCSICVISHCRQCFTGCFGLLAWFHLI